MNTFKCKSVRLCRYLYSLGFEKQSFFEDGNEYWIFEKSNRLQKALDFFFFMRKTGANDNKIQYRNCESEVQ